MNKVNFTEGSEREKERRDRGRERRGERETRGREGEERDGERGKEEGGERGETERGGVWTMPSKEELTGRRRPTKWADVKGCMVLVAGCVCVAGGGMARIWQQGREP